MNKTKNLWILWGIAYLLCTVCGFFTVAPGLVYWLFILLGLGFFVPPGMIIYNAVQKQDPKPLRLIRNLCFLSLGLTLATILLNFISIEAPSEWGLALYWILLVVSAPMACSQVWILGMFGWACLLMVCLKYLKQK
jgi:hypothetical protein